MNFVRVLSPADLSLCSLISLPCGPMVPVVHCERAAFAIIARPPPCQYLRAAILVASLFNMICEHLAVVAGI